MRSIRGAVTAPETAAGIVITGGPGAGGSPLATCARHRLRACARACGARALCPSCTSAGELTP
jgi:hypothetical protein